MTLQLFETNAMSHPSRISCALAICALGVLASPAARADDIPAVDPRPLPPSVTPSPAPPDAEDDGVGYVLTSKLVTGGYGAPELKVSSLAGDAVLLAGGQGGWILGHSVVLGGAGYTTITDVISPGSLQSPMGNARLGLGYGGFRMGVILAAKSRIHATAGLLLGGGTARSDTRDDSFRRRDSFFVIEPDLEAEANIARHIRLALGATYRFIGNTEERGFTSTRLSGPAAMLSFRFGEF